MNTVNRVRHDARHATLNATTHATREAGPQGMAGLAAPGPSTWVRRLLPWLLIGPLLALAACGSAAPAASGGTAPAPGSSESAGSPAAAAGSSAATAAPAGQKLVPVRFAAITNASQSYIPVVMQQQGIAAKYGLRVELVPLTTTSQQFTALRSGAADVASGSFLDLLRQRKAGLKAKAIAGFLTFVNPVVAPASKPYTQLSDLRGLRVGTPGATLLDWQILRAAGLKANGFDIGRQATVYPASPPLLNQMLSKGRLDAALQFGDLAFEPVAKGQLKVVTTVPKVMAAAGLDPNSFYLLWMASDQWMQQYPTAVPKLVAAIRATVQVLETQQSVWPALAKRSGMTDASLLPQFIQAERASMITRFSPAELQPTQTLLDELVKVVGRQAIGVTQVDPKAFDFQASSGGS